MKSKRMKKILTIMTAVMLMATAGLTVGDVWATSTKATEKTEAKDKKAKTVTINIIVVSKEKAEVDITVEKITKKKVYSMMRTVELKKGYNYFTHNKGRKGKYRVSLGAYGDTYKQTVTAVQGKYTMLFQVSPPKDGDAKKDKPIEYTDLTKIKQKK